MFILMLKICLESLQNMIEQNMIYWKEREREREDKIAREFLFIQVIEEIE